MRKKLYALAAVAAMALGLVAVGAAPGSAASTRITPVAVQAGASADCGWYAEWLPGGYVRSCINRWDYGTGVVGGLTHLTAGTRNGVQACMLLEVYRYGALTYKTWSHTFQVPAGQLSVERGWEFTVPVWEQPNPSDPNQYYRFEQWQC